MNSAASPQWLARRPLYWLLAAQASLLVQHAGQMPFWLPWLWGLALLYRLRAQRHGWQRLPWSLKLAAVGVGFAATHFTHGGLVSLDAAATLLLTAMALKLMEAHTRRDAWVLLLLGYFALATGFLFVQNLWAGLYALVPLVLLTTAMLSLQDRRRPLHQLAQTGRLLLQGLPLMLALFVLLPRLPPLWSVPQPGQVAQVGMGEVMSPGEVAQLAQSDRLAMRVRFLDPPPPKNQWYWRGAVLEKFDGRSWTAGDAPTLPNVAAGRLTAVEGERWTHQVLLEPSHRRWRFALDVPRSASDGVHRTEGDVLVATPTHERVVYTVVSAPRPGGAVSLSPAERQRWLALPEEGNPRTRSWGRQLAAEGTPEHRVETVLRQFRRQPFHYTHRPPTLGRDGTDEFLFRTRRGFCEHYASAFAVLMRAAEVPARVVAGYQGGEENPLSGSVLVRDRDAHAWVEVWLEGRGWVRVDPTAAVAPERIELGLDQALASAAPRGGEGGFGGRGRDWLHYLSLQRDALEDGWALWVLHYRDERQWQLLTRWLGQVTPWRVGGVLLVAAGLPLGWIALSGWLGQRRAQDPAVRQYRRLCRTLTRAGSPPRPGEAPGGHLERVARQHPEWAESLRRIAWLFNALRYQALRSDQRHHLQRSLRQAVRQFP